jgi:hypothetical protein
VKVPGHQVALVQAALVPVSLAVVALVQAALVLVGSFGGGGPSFNCKGKFSKFANGLFHFFFRDAATMNEITLLLSGFYTHLVGKKVAHDNHVSKITINLTMSKKFADRRTNSIRWIEILLQNGLAEHRKYVISIILAPYFINIKSLSDEVISAKYPTWYLVQ